MSGSHESADDQNVSSTVPHTLDDAIAALEKANTNASSRNTEDATTDANGYKTFVYDPNIPGPWDPGYGGAPDEDDDDEDAKAPQLSTVDKENQPQKGPLPAIDEKPEQTSSNVQDRRDGEDAAIAGEAAEQTVGAAQKKKKKRKPKSKRGLAAITGFEEFYVDAPLTLAEYEEEQGLYDPEIPFTQRIEVAIQRFAARRHMDSTKKDVFDKYLSAGGIAGGPKQFSGGLNAADMSDMSAADIALMKAIHFVDVDRYGGSDAYTVDFEGIAKNFFSSRLPQHYDLTSVNSAKDVQSKTNIIRNFLNYLLHHDVCPDYKDQIFAACNICDLADRELPKTMRAQILFPGDFQTACSEIFGGSCRNTFARNPGWAEEFESEFGMRPDVAQQTFKIGLATQTSDEMSKIYMEQSNALDIQMTKIYDVGLEVTELVYARAEIRNFYEKHEAAKGLKSLGKLRAKRWHPPHTAPQDLTEEEREKAAKKTPKPAENIYEFLIEDYILDTCFVGMKMEVTVRELSFGLKFFDKILGAYCSFYTILPNEMMEGWRKRESEPLPMKKRGEALLDDDEDLEAADGVEVVVPDDEEAPQWDEGPGAEEQAVS
ncbi:MAG: hypothetical protein Q9202_001548 [Teloschistes flavicans]